MDCIFCQIAEGKIPSQTIYQDKDVVAFRDINPKSPVHILIIPRKHIPSLAELADPGLAAHMVEVANQLASKEAIKEKGYRVVINSGSEGGQLVPHLHLHLLGGRQLSDSIG